MVKNLFYIKNYRFHIYNKNVLFMVGSFRQDTMSGERLFAVLDGKKLNLKVEEHELPLSLMQQKGTLTKQYYVWVRLPDNWQQGSKLRIVQSDEKDKKLVKTISVSQLKTKCAELACKVENVQMRDNQVIIKGWYENTGDTKVAIKCHGEKLKIERRAEARPDVKAILPEIKTEDIKGFEIIANNANMDALKMYLRTADKAACISIYPDSHSLFNKFSKIERIVEKTNDSLHQYGVKGTYDKIQRKLLKKDKITYKNWLKLYTPDKKELQRQRNEKWECAPKISLLAVVERESKKYLKRFIQSVVNQTYDNWELCLMIQEEDNLKTLIGEDSRIRVIQKNENSGRAECLNQALHMAKGKYIAFVCTKDNLAPDALYECVTAIHKNPDTDLTYTDEDKMDVQGRNYYDPQFKTDYNPDMLRSFNYISNLCLIKHDLVEKAGALNPEYEDALEYDYILRCTEHTSRINHVAKVLYHERNVEFGDKLKKQQAERKALEAYLKRHQIEAEVLDSEVEGCYHVKYQVKENPLVSVIIPNKDHTEDLDKCLRSLEEVNAYQNMEYIIVENNSEKKETFEYYDRIQKEISKVKVIYWKEKGFNYPAINNAGVDQSNGDYLLFLNNDTEIVNADCIEEMLGQCQRPEVGAVGARLYYEDGTIQHAGVIVGLGGVAGHAFVGYAHEDTGYCGRIALVQDYSAVTAACMMVERKVFEEVEGFDERYAVAFNDVDLCLKIRKAGYWIVYDPYAELNHYESKSRGMEDTDEKVRRFNSEIALFQDRWKDILKEGDPFYNRNLTLAKNDFSLADDR